MDVFDVFYHLPKWCYAQLPPPSNFVKFCITGARGRATGRGSTIYFCSFAFHKRVHSGFSISLFPLTSLFIESKYRNPFFRVRRPVARYPNEGEVSGFHRCPCGPIMKVRIPRMVMRPTSQRPFGRSRAHYLFRTLIRGPQARLRILRMMPLTTRNIMAFFARTYAIYRMRRRSSLFQNRHTSRPNRTFRGQCRILPFIIVPFRIHFHIHSSMVFPLPHRPWSAS